MKTQENVTSLETSLEETTSSLKTNLSTQESAAAAAKGEIAGLTTKAYTMKTTLFEQQSELSVVKADQSNLDSKMGNLEAKLTSAAAARESQIKELAAVRSDVSALRTGLTGLTNSMFNLKQQVTQGGGPGAKEMDERMKRVSEDVTAVGREVSRLRRDFADTGEEMQTITAEVGAFQAGFAKMSAQMSAVADPPRFSCAVTSDEIRTSGVITYNICNVNTDGLMDRETGHVTVKQAGDYFVSFTGNMVSANAQAVWCALYKQSAGNDGWQVRTVYYTLTQLLQT